jgi:anti-sigma regulatory factor (Ser/Thr protein kinase)
MTALPAIIPVGEATRIAEVRRIAIAMAEVEGLEETATGEVAVIASEAATNLLKHARSGEIHLSRLSHAGSAGVEILSIDRGPGMTNLQNCIVDGFSTSATSGTGLGAISRMADIFDAWSQPGRGTVLVARKYAAPLAAPKSAWDFGAVQVPYPGERHCGDNWGVRSENGVTSVILADGLGHGLLAAEASAAAVRCFQKSSFGSPAFLLENVHAALRSTRGAAVAIACLAPDCQVRYAGLGNISGVLPGARRSQSMVSHNGTAGMDAGRFQEFNYTLSAERTIVMHSDGLSANWNLDGYAGILRRHPSILAGILYRDFSRGRDDACVLAGRFRGE